MTTPAAYLTGLFGLHGRVALVTGGSSGIGRAIATALAAAGARVVLLARGETALRDTAGELRAAGHDADYVVADLADRAQVRRAAADAAVPFGDPDILVHSAAVNLRPPLGDLGDDVWDTTLAVNLTAPFLLGRHFAPRMARRGYGRILHLSSQQAFRAFADSGAYGASKGGVTALARSEAEAWSPHGVTSNALVPGFVATPLNAHLSADPGRVAALAARTLTGRNGVPADFAGAAVFLAGPAASAVTGQAIFVDGGFSAH
ncbi:Gluconate 5-dehydrogenase [Actinomadura rubteroloni]|uniref:Gluconate 5-dehydrogenase n=1 Tax=Actinomadura rubteroloni TaxID=1926885 RepID=A0A2P4UC34_9ACTN|nr:SDR family oxidoreductase [Actinomadura rubteroloni]POM22607.1 Gluconate 5-dehydrogenase [Actinomadura rubteroloni]